MFSMKSGFTLVEILVASIIGVFVAMVAVGALRTISASAKMIDANIDAAAEVRFASKIIATDLVNLYRDRNPKNNRFIGTVDQTEYGRVSRLTFYTVGRIKARAGQPEGDVYEVEYYLINDGQRRALMRRLWPNPDKDTEAGGVLTAIAEDIDVFEVRFFDGSAWQDSWPEETASFPQLVEVSIAAKPSGLKDAIMETFAVNFTKGAGGDISFAEETGEEAEEIETTGEAEEIGKAEDTMEGGDVSDVNKIDRIEQGEKIRMPEL